MKKVIDFLKENSVMTLATSRNDKPRASILEYYMVDDAIVFATAHDSIKAVNLKHNKHISISVFATTKYVTIDGTVAVPTKDQIESYNKQMFVKHPEFKDMVEKGGWHDMSYFRVVPNEAYLNDMSKGMVPPEVFKA